MTTTVQTVPAYQAVKQQATYNVFESLVFMAMETGNVPGAQSRIQEAKECLPTDRVQAIIDSALEEYGIDLS